jgi:hypothetical protein
LKKVLVLFLIVMALVAGAAFVACGGGDDEDKDGKTTPVAQETKEANGGEEETPAVEPTEEEEDGGGGNGGGSLADVPIYPGAKKVSSGEWSGSEAMIPAIGGNENPEDFGTIKYGMYETDDSPGDVFDWYKDKMSGWNEEWVFSSSGEDGAGSVGIWSKDDGKTAAWIVVGEDGGTTSLTIMTGSQ